MIKTYVMKTYDTTLSVSLQNRYALKLEQCHSYKGGWEIIRVRVTGTCSEIQNPVSVILKINRSRNHKLVYPYF